MSIRAYIVREKHIWVNEDRGFFQYNNDGENLIKYTHTDKEYCLNVSSQMHLIKLMKDYGAEDYTNNDWLGVIEMGREDFESMMENSGVLNSSTPEEDFKSLSLIKKYFEEGWRWIVLDCY